MQEFLISICFHEPEGYNSWLKGEIEDFESSARIFITAKSEIEALKWGEAVANQLFKECNPNEIKDWKSFGYDCRVVDIGNSAWSHCLNFFQRISYGEMPNFDLMGTIAYKKWVMNNFNEEWIIKTYGKYFYE
jgi:hypothetical protein